MSQNDIAHESSKKKVAGVFGRLFERGEHSRSAKTATLDLGDIQGFILRGYRMPMVRHFLLTVSVPAEARKLLGRFVSGEESDAPQITTAEDCGTWGSSRDQGTNSPTPRAASPTIA